MIAKDCIRIASVTGEGETQRGEIPPPSRHLIDSAVLEGVMNYGEEYGLWYLRLNGFFPISNFVIHRSTEIVHSSDCDLLAIRPPFVYEEIGGNSEDWDLELTNILDFNRTIGVICEVKTGDYDVRKLFKKKHLKYTISRLGFVPQNDVDDLVEEFESKAVFNIKDSHQIVKILIAEDGKNNSKYHFRSQKSVYNFLRQRVLKYPQEKYADRMFFGSILFQSIIDTTVMNRGV